MLGKIDMVGGISLVLLGVAFIWLFWLEVGLTSYRARSYILGQVTTIMEGLTMVEKKEVEEKKITVH